MPGRTLEEYYFAQKQHEKKLGDQGITEGYDIEASLGELGFGEGIDVAGGAAEMGTQMLGGVRDALEEFGNALAWLASELDFGSVEDPFTALEEGEYGGRVNLKDIGVPEIAHSDSTVASLSRGITQFITGFVLMSAITGPLGGTVAESRGFMSLIAKAPKIAKWLGVIGEGATAGALTDAFFFDPDDPRMGALIDQLAPSLKNPITDYLAAAPDDSESLKRFKAATEGLIIGSVFNALLPIVKGMRHVRLKNMGYHPGTTFRKVSPEEFIAARAEGPRQSYLTAASADDLKNHDLYLNEFGNTGVSVSPDGDIGNLFNASSTPGLGTFALEKAMRNGGNTLDHFDGFLTDYYAKFGFEEYDRVDFNPDFAPENWDYDADGTPAVVFQKRKGMGDVSTINYVRKKSADTVRKLGPLADLARRAIDNEGGYLYIEFPEGRIPVEDVVPVSQVGAGFIALGDTDGYGRWLAKLNEDYTPKHVKQIAKQAEKTFDSYSKSAEDAFLGKMQSITDRNWVKGKKGAYWYDETFGELETMFGREDAEILSGFLAAGSINTDVTQNTMIAMKAYRAYKKGMAEGGIGMAEHNIKKAFPDVRAYHKKGPMKGKPMFTQAGTPVFNKSLHQKHLLIAARGEIVGAARGPGRKIHNFHKALLGDPDAVVVDRWMMRAYGIAGKDAPTTLEYDMIEKLVRDGAERVGATPRQYQASLWKAQKIIEGDTRFAGEYQTLIRDELKANPALRDELGLSARNSVMGNDRGWTRFAASNMIARFLFGATAGGAVGDTWEERLRNAAIVGFGAAPLSPALAKHLVRKIAKSRDVVDSISKAAGKNLDEAGAGVTSQMDHAPAAKVAVGPEGEAIKTGVGEPLPTLTEMMDESWEDLRKEAAAYAGKVEEQRRGSIPREESMAEGARLKAAGELPEEIAPGTAMTAEYIAGISLKQAEIARDVQTLAKLAEASGDPEQMDAALRGMARIMEMDPQRLGVEAEAGRGLGIIQETPELDYVRNMMKTIEETPSMSKERLISVIARMESPEELVAVSKRTKFQKGQDMFIEYWMNGILSGPQTHMANFMGNLTTTLFSIPERALAARMVGGSGDVVKGEAAAMVYALFGSLYEGLQMAGESFAKGEPMTGVTKFTAEARGGRFAKQINAANMGVDGGAIGRSIDFLGTVANMPTRMIMTADEFFKIINYRMQLRADAFRQATLNGITDPLEKANFIEALIADPTPKMRTDARQFAAVNTFQNELGKIGQALTRVSGSHPMIKLILPFVTTPTNIAKWTAHRTPGLAHMTDSFRTAMKKGGAEADLAQAKMAMGGLMSLAFIGLAATDQITGSRPKNAALAAQMHDSGWQEHSMRIGDNYYGLDRFDPVAMQMGMVADFVHAMSYGMGSEGIDPLDFEEMGTAMLYSMADNVTSKTWMQGVSKMMKAVQQPDRFLKRYARDMASSFIPFSGAVSQFERAQDPRLSEITKEVRGIYDNTLSKMPWFSNDLPVRRYPTSGEAMTARPEPGEGFMPLMWRFISPMKVSPIGKDPLSEAERTMSANNVTVGFFSNTYQGVDLTPDEKDWLHAAAGANMGELLPTLVNNEYFKTMAHHDPDLAQDFINNQKRQVWDNDAMRLEFMERFPEYTKALEDRKEMESTMKKELQQDLGGMTNILGGGQ